MSFTRIALYNNTPPNRHLSDKKKQAILALHRHAVSQMDIAEDTCRNPTTVYGFWIGIDMMC